MDYHTDALGSVRQLGDASQEIIFSQSYDPYGNVQNTVTAGPESNYGYTNEQTSQGLIYLRARYYDPEVGRFLSSDPLNGFPTRPISYNKWAYAYDNPILLTDPSGLSPMVDCEKIWLPNMRGLCKVANGDDNDPTTLDAREEFFWNIVYLSSGIDEGYYWAGTMLANFLRGTNYVDVNLPSNTTFGTDAGILRATKFVRPGLPDEPTTITPLLHVFLNDYIQDQVSCEGYQTLPNFPVSGEDTYMPIGTQPRGRHIGWWGAFGHVIIDAMYSNISILSNVDKSGYVIKAKVDYVVNDKYEWFENKLTPLPLGSPRLGWPPVGLVNIPHEWQLSLVKSGRAFESDFKITWSEHLQIVVPEDFSQFNLIGEGTYPLN